MASRPRPFARSYQRRLRGLVVSIALAGAGCAGGTGGGTASPGPEAPTYGSVAEEALDLPSQMTAQVKWAMEPIDNVAVIANDIAALRAELDLEPAEFEALCKQILEGDKPSLDMLAPEARAQAEATFDKLRKVGKELGEVPARVKTASGNLVKLGMNAPRLAMKAGKELQSRLGSASPAELPQLKQDIEQLQGLPAEVKAQLPELKDQVLGLPDRAQESLQALLGVFAGDPPPPLPADETSPDSSAGGDTRLAAGDPGADDGGSSPQLDPGSFTTMPPGSQLVGPPPSRPIRRPTEAELARYRAFVIAGKARLDSGDPLGAALLWEQAYRSNPGDHRLALEIARAAQQGGECDAARAYASSYLSREDSDIPLDTISEARRLRDAACQPMSESASKARARSLRGLGQQLTESGDPLGAAAAYAAAMQYASDDEETAWLATTSAAEIGDCERARTYASNYIALRGDAAGSRRRTTDERLARARELADGPASGACVFPLPGRRRHLVEGTLASASRLERRGEWLSARAALEAASDFDPMAIEAHLALARAAWTVGDCALTERAFERATKAGWSAEAEQTSAGAWPAGAWATLQDVGCPAGPWLARLEPAEREPTPRAETFERPGDVPGSGPVADDPGGRRLLIAGTASLAGGLAAAAALIGTGSWAIVSANSAYAQADTDAERDLALFQRSNGFTNVYVGTATAVAATIAGGVMLGIGRKQSRESTTAIAPVIGPQQAGVTARIRF